MALKKFVSLFESDLTMSNFSSSDFPRQDTDEFVQRDRDDNMIDDDTDEDIADLEEQLLHIGEECDCSNCDKAESCEDKKMKEECPEGSVERGGRCAKHDNSGYLRGRCGKGYTWDRVHDKCIRVVAGHDSKR